VTSTAAGAAQVSLPAPKNIAREIILVSRFSSSSLLDFETVAVKEEVEFEFIRRRTGWFIFGDNNNSA
jgi:hypothetical protein